MEKCVDCQKEVSIPKQTHIHNRIHYIEGVGQLCSACFISIYGQKEKETKINYNLYGMNQKIYNDES